MFILHGLSIQVVVIYAKTAGPIFLLYHHYGGGPGSLARPDHLSLQHLLHLVHLLGLYVEVQKSICHSAGGSLHMNGLFCQLCLPDVILFRKICLGIWRVELVGRHAPQDVCCPEWMAVREHLGRDLWWLARVMTWAIPSRVPEPIVYSRWLR